MPSSTTPPDDTTAGTPTAQTTAQPTDPLVGVVTRQAIEEHFPAWRDALQQATPDAEAARALASAPRGAEVHVYLGTWCGDSRREVTRLWKAIDMAGSALPFEIEYVGVDRAKQAPGGLLDGIDLQYVPTFVVKRNGREVGRIIESPPSGSIERDLGALLRGEQRGALSGRPGL